MQVRIIKHKCFVLTVFPLDTNKKVKWRKGSKFYGELSFVPSVHEENNQPRLLASMQSSSIRNLLRSVFPKAWEQLYDFAVFFGDKDFQKTYLQNRIKKHDAWVESATIDFAATGCQKSKKRIVYNSSTLRKLQKRLERL
jgi:hypothetical protein